MPNLHHNSRPGLRGLDHASAFLQTFQDMGRVLHPVGADYGPVANLNRCILDAYLRAVVEDETTPTGFRYDDQSDDETVA